MSECLGNVLGGGCMDCLVHHDDDDKENECLGGLQSTLHAGLRRLCRFGGYGPNGAEPQWMMKREGMRRAHHDRTKKRSNSFFFGAIIIFICYF